MKITQVMAGILFDGKGEASLQFSVRRINPSVSGRPATYDCWLTSMTGNHVDNVSGQLTLSEIMEWLESRRDY